MKLQKIGRLIVMTVVLIGLVFCLNACGDNEESDNKKTNSCNSSTNNSTNYLTNNAVQILVDDYGKYYNITYDEFIDKLGEAITYAAGGDPESKALVNDVTLVYKALNPNLTYIDDYSKGVYSRKLLFHAIDMNGYMFELFDMVVYSTIDTNKIVRVAVEKINMLNTYPDSELWLTRFNVISNAVTELLTGEPISKY